MENKYKNFLKLSHKKGLENIQITEITNISKEARLINGNLIDIEYHNNINYDVQADYNEKTIKAGSNYLDEEIIDILLEKGKNLECKNIDIIKDLSKNNDLYEDIRLDIEDIIKESKKTNDLLKNDDIITTYISSVYSKNRIVNEFGVDMSSSNILNRYSIEVILKRDGIVKTSDSNILFNSKDSINYTKLQNNLISEMLLSINEKTIESKKYKVLFKNNVMSIILKKIIPFLDFEKVQNKTSFLEGKLNKKIFSDKITITENPLNKDMPGYRTFDDEGTTTYNKTIVKNGKLLTYLCNNSVAKENNIKSTGNSYKAVTTRNMILECGNYTYNELIEKLGDGLIITDIFSNYNIDIKDSKASFQCYGLLVENGKIIGGLKSFIVTTSYFDLFNNVEEIGNDLLFNNVVCSSPSIIASNISITI